MRRSVIGMLLLAVLMVGGAARAGQNGNRVDDPAGVLRKPIPDKLVALTFDDGPASGYTVIAPILKAMGFGGSFYIADFDSFHTRKDWYLTYRQMQQMARDGFEIGNHTMGHVGGASIEPFLNLEDELLANGVPKPTTACWPVYQVNTRTYPDLAAHGYLFGRGGHDRAYRPTIDNPFDIPSFSVANGTSVETFANYVQQASKGRIVVITFHGIPDMEHPPVSLEPATFRAMMQYLKDNHYRAIALRDLAEYIDPAKAAKLPPTSDRSPEPTASALTAPRTAPDRPHNNGTPAPPPGKFSHVAPPTTRERIDQTERGKKTISTPLTLDEPLTVDAAKYAEILLDGPISGAGPLIKTGQGRLQVGNKINTYSGGTVVYGGSLYLIDAHRGLGTGPVTLYGDAELDLEHIDGTNPLILNDGTINAGNGFGDKWDAPITLNGDTKLSAYAEFLLNSKSGGISGPGGLTHTGAIGPFGMVNSGTISLAGDNTYTGPTTVKLGMLRLLKAVSLYHADATQWTPDRITIAPAATLWLNAGGPDEFTGDQIGTLLHHLTASVNDNGLMNRAVFCINITDAGTMVDVATVIADSKGQGGGFFTLDKRGSGTLQLSGNNTYTGQTVLKQGTLRVSSLNSVVKGRPYSSLGAPKDVENGEILLGHDDANCTLTYTGTGETTDRVLNLAGKQSTVTFDQSGTGPLKLTRNLLISGYGTSKTIVLQGNTAGTGEFAGGIDDPYDRAHKATTSITKSGTGTWTLSGVNHFTGRTTVKSGTLQIANQHSLSGKSDLSVASGAVLDLRFRGRIDVEQLSLGGKPQPKGTYNAKNSPDFLHGTGEIRVK